MFGGLGCGAEFSDHLRLNWGSTGWPHRARATELGHEVTCIDLGCYHWSEIGREIKPTAWKRTMVPTDLLELEITKLVKSDQEIAAIQQHVKEIAEGPAFKSSQRCRQFLQHIVDQSIAGHFELLKERLIGVELFGRPPDYDTGEDAIVRVTASEVRRRLLQHYAGTVGHLNYRIGLPLGSYIPSIACLNHADAAVGDASEGRVPRHGFGDGVISPEAALLLVNGSHAAQPPREGLSSAIRAASRGWVWIGFGALLLILNTGLWFAFRSPMPWKTPWALSTPPWSAMFRSANPTVLITSDPNIAEIQGYTGGQLTVSDYANHNYLAGPNKLNPEEERFCRVVLRGDKASSVDTPIAVSVAELAESVSKKIEVRGARDIQLADLKTDSNFVFLGSPRSDPWSGLFSDQLDFKFVIDAGSKREVIVNVHPRPNEQKTYVPTAPGWATGQSYAIVASLQNPDFSGRVLLLAGANGEGTEAAGKLVTDPPRFSQALGQCGFDLSRAATNFEMLLRLNTMAGSSSHVDVVACHVLRTNAQ